MGKGPFRVRDLGTLDDKLSDAEAAKIFHYRITLDDKGRCAVEERYREGNVLQDRAEFEYSQDCQTKITVTRCYNAQGNYTGKVVGRFTPPNIHEAEVYDAQNNLRNKIGGLFRYELMDGKPVRR